MQRSIKKIHQHVTFSKAMQYFLYIL